jgi:hypothetical protein
MPERSLTARDSQGSTEDLQKPGYMALPKFREALNKMPVRHRSKVNTLIKQPHPL